MTRMWTVAGLLALVALLALACGGAGADGKLTLALNWKPEPEFGGIYAALDDGAFARRGLDVELTGGPGASVVQMLIADRADFGVVSADEIVLARDRGADVVAVFATYQTSPQGLMVHAESGVGSLKELFRAGGRLAVEPGLPYVKFLQQRYDLSRVEIVPYGYSIAPFLSDPEMAQQVFVTSEPIAARRKGESVRVFLVADSGYNPYTAVIATRGARMREAPEEVRAFVAALREGWRSYLDDPSATNARMGALNPEMDAESFRLAALAQARLVETAWTRAHGLGSMQAERWRALGEQLHALGLVDEAPRADACWVDVEGQATR